MNDRPRLKPASTDLRRQVALTLALQVLAAVVMGGPLLVTGALVNDRLADFYLFRDTLHSLNVYGEFPWWNPSIWAGFPSYYISFLYWPGREPLAAAIAVVAWLLGRLQVTIQSYHALYVAYFAFLVPLLLSLSVLALARQILRRPLAVYLVVVLMAFSPGVVLSLSDAGTDVAAYGFFFAAALLHFLRRPTRSSFLLMCLPAIAMAAVLTYVQLFWNSFFVPVFIALVCVGTGGRGPQRGNRVGVHLTRRATRALRSVPGRWWAAAAAGVCLCALPSIVAYGQGTDILSFHAQGRRYYSYEALRPGTPLEALALSTPGVGFEWTGYYENPDASFDPQPVSRTSSFSSYGYMGLLTLPLVCMGLVLGRPYWSIRLYGCIAGVLTIVLLSAYSPIFSLLLGWPSPLRGDHFSDLVFRQGFFALFALAAGLGVESLMRSRPSRRWILMGLFAAASAASVAWLVSLQGPAVTHNYVFGLALALMLLYAIGLTRLALARTPVQIRHAFIVLLALTLVDTSTLAFAHLRLSLTHARDLPTEPDAGTIGSVIGHHEESFLYLRGMNDPALLSDPARPVTLMAADTGEPLARQDVDISRRTYNTLAVRVNASQPSRLEWRDAYFPFWRAWVNGAEAPVQRTPEGMKAVLVPAGGSDVIFRFSPSVLRATVAVSYLTMAAALVFWVLARRTANR